MPETKAALSPAAATHRRTVGGIVMGVYRRSAITVAFGAVAIIIGQFAALLVPKFTGMAVDSVKTLGSLVEDRHPDALSRAAESISGLSSDTPADDRLLICLIAMGVLTLIVAVFQFTKRYQLIGLSRHCEYALREELFHHVQLLPLPFFTRMRSGDLISRATSDIEAVRMMIGPAVMYVTDVAVVLPITIVAMMLISPVLTAWALLPLAFLTLSTLWFSPRQRKHSFAVQERQADLSARAQENFSGARVVRAFGREKFESAEFDKLGARLMESQLALAKARAMFQASIWTLNGAGLLVFLYVGSQEIAAHRMSMGQFLEFVFFFALLYWPMISLGWVIMLVVRGRVSAKRINEVFAENPDTGVSASLAADGAGPQFASARPRPPEIRGEIEFRGVGFSYGEGKPVLRDLSFRVPAGKTLAVVGQVGSGKSTVAQLILRLREPNSGSIMIDGKPITDFDASGLRRRIGYVPQETFLFSESIGDNISFGLDEAAAPDIADAARTAQLASEVAEIPGHYDALLGERGVNLSGGQKQRAAIARALILKPAIMVLDDCLSAVDTKTEEAILSGLKRDLAGTTVIIIAQRVSTVAHADEIIVLEDGCIVERGTDASLRAAGGLYADMARSQAQKAGASVQRNGGEPVLAGAAANGVR
jgi:ATP-binding cassette subfamily B multidrug efflux pump